MRTVVVDANVLVSFFVDRNVKQRDAADELLQRAEAGEIAAIVPQFVVSRLRTCCRASTAPPANNLPR